MNTVQLDPFLFSISPWTNFGEIRCFMMREANDLKQVLPDLKIVQVKRECITR
jgi:hypothetical protein